MKAASKIDLFLKMGVPDWRLEKLPILYQELISNEKLLIEDGLNKNELWFFMGSSKKLRKHHAKN